MASKIYYLIQNPDGKLYKCIIKDRGRSGTNEKLAKIAYYFAQRYLYVIFQIKKFSYFRKIQGAHLLKFLKICILYLTYLDLNNLKNTYTLIC